MEYAIARVESVLPRLYLLAQGGTAVGTGLNTTEGFDEGIASLIAEEVNYKYIIMQHIEYVLEF